MVNATLTLPEARTQVSEAIHRFNTLAAAFIEPIARGKFPSEEDTTFVELVKLLREVDRLLDTIRERGVNHMIGWDEPCQMAQALRYATFLALRQAKPEHAWYWAEERQRRIRQTDSLLTPSTREEARAGIERAYAALTDEERRDIQEENSAFDGVLADGLDDD